MRKRNTFEAMPFRINLRGITSSGAASRQSCADALTNGATKICEENIRPPQETMTGPMMIRWESVASTHSSRTALPGVFRYRPSGPKLPIISAGPIPSIYVAIPGVPMSGMIYETSWARTAPTPKRAARKQTTIIE
jgi:hypothetical protein